MKPQDKLIYLKHRGSALIISMIFILIFSALAMSMAAFSGANLQIAQNQRKANRARAAAESGLETIRLWIGIVSISGKTPPEQRFEKIADALQTAAYNISNVATGYQTSSIVVPTVTINSAKNQSFYALLTPLPAPTNLNSLQANITGVCDQFTKTIRANFQLGQRANTVFDFGVASKGPLSLAGNIELEGVNVSVESNVYIESPNDLLALSIIGNSHIAGDVSIVNPIAGAYLQGGQASIGGETGQNAVDNHVKFGVPPSEFPEPDPAFFEPYATSIIDANTDTSSDATFENVRILAGTNPLFSGNVTLKGVVFIEAPNVVRFEGSANVIGIIVGNGDINDDSATNQIIFQGTVDSLPVTELPPDEQFNAIRDQTGTFAVAPGFALSFGGNFHTLSGAIAGNGVEFFGNAGGTINGSVINYSEGEMTLTGNSDLYFNRSGTAYAPAGFVPQIVLHYDPTSYREIIL